MGTHATNRDNGYRCQNASPVASRSSHPCPPCPPDRFGGVLLNTADDSDASAASSSSVAAPANTARPDACPTDPVNVVVSVDQWGDIVSELGGSCATVKTVLTSSSVDPHDYEPSPADATSFAGAQLVVRRRNRLDITDDGRVELVVGRGSRRTLDARFVPAPASVTVESCLWTSYVAWAFNGSGVDGPWRIGLVPDFLLPGHTHQLAPLQAPDEHTARSWLALLAHTWLHLVTRAIAAAPKGPVTGQEAPAAS